VPVPALLSANEIYGKAAGCSANSPETEKAERVACIMARRDAGDHRPLGQGDGIENGEETHGGDAADQKRGPEDDGEIL
jgi:hypothetical protein